MGSRRPTGIGWNPDALKVEMAQSQSWQEIPTRLSVEEFEQFAWPHRGKGRRGPARKLSAHTPCRD